MQSIYFSFHDRISISSGLAFMAKEATRLWSHKKADVRKNIGCLNISNGLRVSRIWTCVGGECNALTTQHPVNKKKLCKTNKP